MTSTSQYTIFKKQKHRGTLYSEFLMSPNYSFNVIQKVAVSTKQVVLIYIYMGVSVYWPACAVCLCLCVISNQSTSKKPCRVLDKVLVVLRYQGLACVDP